MQILQHVRQRFIGLNWDSQHLDPFLCSLCLWLCQLHAPLLEDVLRHLGKKGQVFLIPPVQPHYVCIPASLELSTATEILLFPRSWLGKSVLLALNPTNLVPPLAHSPQDTDLTWVPIKENAVNMGQMPHKKKLSFALADQHPNSPVQTLVPGFSSAELISPWLHSETQHISSLLSAESLSAPKAGHPAETSAWRPPHCNLWSETARKELGIQKLPPQT